MDNERTPSKRLRNLGAALCCIILCGSMVAALAATSPAQAEAETSLGQSSDSGPDSGSAQEINSVSTTYKVAGYYLRGDYRKLIHPASTEGILVSTYISIKEGVAYGYDTDDTLVELPQLDIGPNQSSYIASEDLEAFLQASQLKLYGSRPDVSGYDPDLKVSVWTLYETIPAAQTKTEPIDVKNEPPETERILDDAYQDDSLIEPEPMQESTKPAPAEPTDSVTTEPKAPAPTEQPTSSPEGNTFLTHCPESEAEAKIAELEAQGYEIVSIERIPAWYR